MTSQYDENVITATSRVYRVAFVDSQVLDFVVEVSLSFSSVGPLVNVNSTLCKIRLCLIKVFIVVRYMSSSVPSVVCP